MALTVLLEFNVIAQTFLSWLETAQAFPLHPAKEDPAEGTAVNVNFVPLGTYVWQLDETSNLHSLDSVFEVLPTLTIPEPDTELDLFTVRVL